LSLRSLPSKLKAALLNMMNFFRSITSMNIMKKLLIFLILQTCLYAADTFTPITSDANVPQNVLELWEGYDPTLEPIEKEVIKTYTDEEGVITEYVLFTVATVKGVKSRIAAFYSYPENGSDLPAFVWAHGGGQRADRARGVHFAKQGYATIDINWNGSEIDAEVEQNTNWGMVDPTQGAPYYPLALRAVRHLSMVPDEYTIDTVISPRNKYWFMLAVAGRRAITFLEQQPEVDGDKIGFTGFSMGGNITAFTAIDSRLKAVAPQVGGIGHGTEPHPGYPNQTVTLSSTKVLENDTIIPEAYWQHVSCPVMFVSSTNDFHGQIDYVQLCADFLPHDHWVMSQTPHANHSLDAEQYLALQYWFDQHLKGESYSVPSRAVSTFTEVSDEYYEFTVTPDRPGEVESVTVYYSWDSAITNRFNKPLSAENSGGVWRAQVPYDKELPLYAYADVVYTSNGGAVESTLGGEVASYAISTRFYSSVPSGVSDTTYAKWNKRTFDSVFARFPEDNLIWRRGGRHTTYKFNDYSQHFPADKSLKFHLNANGQLLTLSLAFTSNSHITGRTNELHRGSVFIGHHFSESGTYIVHLEDLVNRAGQQATSWHNLSNMTLQVIDRRTGQSIDLLDPETSGTYVSLIEWVDKDETTEVDPLIYGVPTSWLLANGYSTSINDAKSDIDRDGFSARQEYVAGTDPNERSSAMVVNNLEIDNGENTITWKSVRGKSYNILHTERLSSGSWSTIATDIVGGAPETSYTFGYPNEGNRAAFYRVEAVANVSL